MENLGVKDVPQQVRPAVEQVYWKRLSLRVLGLSTQYLFSSFTVCPTPFASNTSSSTNLNVLSSLEYAV